MSGAAFMVDDVILLLDYPDSVFPGIGFYFGRASGVGDNIGLTAASGNLIATLPEFVAVLALFGIAIQFQLRALLKSPYNPRTFSLDGGASGLGRLSQPLCVFLGSETLTA